MENNTNNGGQKMSTPMAIVVAGALIMVGILLTKNGSSSPVSKSAKTPSEQLGISKKEMSACVSAVDANALGANITKSVENAMSDLPSNQRGTPYSVVIGKNGVMTDIRGALDYASTKKIIDEAMSGKVTSPYKGKIALYEPNDHIMGNAGATVTVIEYSDFECPFCKRFHPIMEQIVKESNGQIKWVYRQFPLHQHSFEKLVAAECVAQLKGDEAYFKYADLLFGLLKTGDEPVVDQL